MSLVVNSVRGLRCAEARKMAQLSCTSAPYLHPGPHPVPTPPALWGRGLLLFLRRYTTFLKNW